MLIQKYMKTKELIKLLKEEDPSGELECCIHNQDILSVYQEIAYWDGCLQILKRDIKKKTYNVIGAKYTSEGFKVSIIPYGIEDALWHNPDLPVEVIDTFLEKNMQKAIDRKRMEIKKALKEIKIKRK